MHLRSLQKYLVFVCVFMASVVIYGSITEGTITSDTWKGISRLLNVIVLVFNTYFLFQEGIQMFNADESIIQHYNRINIQNLEVCILYYTNNNNINNINKRYKINICLY